ncbi:MAG: diphthamide biosynthesis enzyme Dph2 [Candidatus Heimdallarchaeota archaeon]
MKIDYDLAIPSLTKTIQKKGWNRVLVQMPEGMLNHPLQEVLTALKALNVTVFVEGEPSYGVCDLAVDTAIGLKVDALIHYGHTSFGFEQRVHSAEGMIDVVLVPALIGNYHIDLPEIIKKIKELDWKKVGLTATAQHMMYLHNMKDQLEAHQIESAISQHGGQILGCYIGKSKTEFGANDIDGIVSLHPGNFHTRGLLFLTSRPILQIDPITGNLSLYTISERDTLIKKRFAVIEKARKATTWGIVSSLKHGQWQPNPHKRASRILSEAGLKFVELVGKTITPLYLANFTWIDAWVNTACPRIALDDVIRYHRPMITFQEFLYLFDQITWNQLLERGFM